MPETTRDAEEAATLKKLLGALEAMAGELAERRAEDITFKVSIHRDVPMIGVLGDLVNKIGSDWENRVRAENERTMQRSRELSQAYEALQSKNEEIQRDLDAARRVQLRLLPQPADTKRCAEVDFAGHYVSKDKVGGDIYDFWRIGLNSWAFLVADVSGHGVPPALLTMFLKAAFRTRSRWGAGADSICREVNADLCAVVSDLGLYVTAFFGIIDLETGAFRYANCGHPPVYLYRPGSDEVLRLEEKGMILGALEEIQLEQSVFPLEPGDIVLATTDGIPESRNFLGEMYGESRLLDSFARACRGLGPEPGTMDIICTIIADLGIFTLDAPPDDDVTTAAFRLLGLAARGGGH
jgi:sigma-B regulation protein RsbU (phosphoserine phosphatase)